MVKTLVAKVAKTFGRLDIQRRAAETLGEFRYQDDCGLSALGATSMQFQQLLTMLAEWLNLDSLSPNEQGVCELVFDDGLEVDLRELPGSRLLLQSDVSKPPVNEKAICIGTAVPRAAWHRRTESSKLFRHKTTFGSSTRSLL